MVTQIISLRIQSSCLFCWGYWFTHWNRNFCTSECWLHKWFL